MEYTMSEYKTDCIDLLADYLNENSDLTYEEAHNLSVEVFEDRMDIEDCLAKIGKTFEEYGNEPIPSVWTM